MLEPSMWVEAQKKEKVYWVNVKDSREESVPRESLLRFCKLLKLLERAEVKKDYVVTLDIGSGPNCGIFNVLRQGSLKIAIDPLFGYFSFGYPSDVERIKGVAESLPIRSNCVSATFSINMLDHTKAPEIVVSESSRVQNNDGILGLMVQVVSAKMKAINSLFHHYRISKNIGLQLHKMPRFMLKIVLGAFRILGLIFNEDVYAIFEDGFLHPHYLTSKDVFWLLSSCGFSPLFYKIVCDDKSTKKADLYVILENNRTKSYDFETS